MPRSNLFYCSNYDETYSVIYEIIQGKSLEALWAVKIARYIEILTHGSSEYIISHLLHCPIKQSCLTACGLLAYTMPYPHMTTYILATAVYSYGHIKWLHIACAYFCKRPFSNRSCLLLIL